MLFDFHHRQNRVLCYFKPLVIPTGSERENEIDFYRPHLSVHRRAGGGGGNIKRIIGKVTW